jgi:trehalose 6-phosphate phosphatase
MPAPPRASTADEAFRRTVEHASDSIFFFDFDGTLAEIQENPDSVRPAPGVLDTLAMLRTHIGQLVIVSARPVAFLARHFDGLPGLTLFGLYGLEVRRGDGPIRTDPTAIPYLDAMATLARRAEAELPAGALVEYKRLSVALHYRTAPDLRDVVEAWAAQRADEAGLRAQRGRMVVELKPPGRNNKGSVVREEIGGTSCAWYFGDDVSDLEAFAALDERQAADEKFVAIRVAVDNPETGHELDAAADLRLAGPTAIPPFLAALTTALRAAFDSG